MLVLGIDPGTATTGYGVIEKNGKGVNVVDWGLIETDKDGSPETRLKSIFEEMLAVLKLHKPDIIAIEKLFFATNAKTAMRVGQAQGVMLLSAACVNTPIVEYAPMSIKKMITGDGRADKKVVQQFVRKFLGAKVRSAKKKRTHFDNAADGLAVALCHLLKVGGLPPLVVGAKGGE